METIDGKIPSGFRQFSVLGNYTFFQLSECKNVKSQSTNNMKHYVQFIADRESSCLFLKSTMSACRVTDCECHCTPQGENEESPESPYPYGIVTFRLNGYTDKLIKTPYSELPGEIFLFTMDVTSLIQMFHIRRDLMHVRCLGDNNYS